MSSLKDLDFDHHRFTVDEVEYMRYRLLKHYKKHKRDLPWRNIAMLIEDGSEKAYSVWVSEVMLQQTQVATVIEYYNKWMRKWPTVKALSKATLQEVNEMWSGLGYYSRGRRLLEGAQKLAKQKGKKKFKMPETWRELMKELPGVGRYTASAIASIAYHQVTGVVDGNVMRVMSRLRIVGAETRFRHAQDLFWHLANSAVDHDEPGDFNQALMELGATICTPKTPKCSECPLRKICKAYARQTKYGGMKVPMKKITDFFNPYAHLDQHVSGDQEVNLMMLVDDEEQERLAYEDENNNPKDATKATNGEISEKDPISEVNSQGEEVTSDDKPIIYGLTDIEDVPGCKFCLPQQEPWREKWGVMNYPRKGAARPPELENFLAVVVEQDGKYMFTQRPAKGLLANMWELPLIEVEQLKDPNDEDQEISVIHKDLKRRYSITKVNNLTHCGLTDHLFSHRFHKYRVYFCETEGVSLDECVDGRKICWMSHDEAQKGAVTKGPYKILGIKDARMGTNGVVPIVIPDEEWDAYMKRREEKKKRFEEKMKNVPPRMRPITLHPPQKRRKVDDEKKKEEQLEQKPDEQKVVSGNELKVDTVNEQKVDAGNDQKVVAGNEQKVDAGNEQKVDAGNEQKVDAGNEQKVEAGNEQKFEQKVDAGNEQKVDSGNEQTIGSGIVTESGAA